MDGMNKPLLVEFVGTPTMFGPDECRLVVDGHDISRFASAVSFDASAGDLSTATVRLVAPRLDIKVPAAVTFNVLAPKGWVIVREPQPDGTERYRCAVDVESLQRTGDEAI